MLYSRGYGITQFVCKNFQNPCIKSAKFKLDSRAVGDKSSIFIDAQTGNGNIETDAGWCDES